MDNKFKNEADTGLQTPANGGSVLDWKTCPICERGHAHSPVFSHFLPLIRHLIEHKTGIPYQGLPVELNDSFSDFCNQVGSPSQSLDSRSRRTIVIKEARRFLPAMADWLEEALASLADLALIRHPGVATAEKLVQLMQALPQQFEEQRAYLLRNKKTLGETGLDPKWPPKVRTQAKFVAASMAGAEFGLAPTTSREYIRRELPRVKPARDNRKSSERRPKDIFGRIRTNRRYDKDSSE